jgi:hypothetical protein
VFSVRSVQRYTEDSQLRISRQSVEAGSNTSTIALRVVGGEEKGTQCPGMQLVHLVPGGYKYGDLAFQDVREQNLRQ